MTNTISQKYNLGPVKDYVGQAANLIGSMFGIKTIYGWRKSDPFPDHPSGHALDIMSDIPTGNNVANFLVANANALGVKYIIHNHQVWNPKQGWHKYTSTSNPHTDHVHVTFNDSPGAAFAGGSLNTSLLNSVGGPGAELLRNATQQQPDLTCAWKLSLGVTDSCVFRKTQVRSFIGGALLVGGASVMLLGVILLTVFAFRETKAGQDVNKLSGDLLSVVPAGKAAKTAAVAKAA